MRKLRKYDESLGDEYSWEVVSSCEQNSMQAIATNDDILIYDPRNGLYCRQSDVVKNSDLEAGIFDMISDPSLKRQVMRPAKGEDFNKFAAEWNALQKDVDRPDIIKTRKTTTFAFNTNEGRKPSKDFMDSKVEKFRNRWRKLGAGSGGGRYGLSKKDRDHLDRLKDYHDDFGDSVNGIEAEVSESDYDDDPRDWSASEGEVEIVWDNDFPRFGIEVGDTEPFVIDYDRVETHYDLLEEVVRLIEEAYPGIEVGIDDFVIDNEDEFWEQRGGGNPGKWE